MPSYFYHLAAWGLFLARSLAQTTASASATSLATAALSTLPTIAASNVSIPTGSYITYSSTVTLSSSVTSAANVSSNGTALSTSRSSSNVLVGSSRPSTGTSTGSSASPSNSQPCNNYPEFCTRKYSNLTFVCGHNSAFAVKNNIFSNQDVSITGQLNDGIRMSRFSRKRPPNHRLLSMLISYQSKVKPTTSTTPSTAATQVVTTSTRDRTSPCSLPSANGSTQIPTTW